MGGGGCFNFLQVRQVSVEAYFFIVEIVLLNILTVKNIFYNGN